MDRESVSAFRSHCVHSKNIFTLADLPVEDESHQKIKKHVENCRACSTQYKNFQLQTEAMRIYIPKPRMDKESKEIFEREVTELFKIFNLDQKLATKKKIKEKILFMDSLGAEFIRNLTSKTMLKSYLLALIAFICLRYYLN